MNQPAGELAAPLAAWLDERDHAALEQACAWARSQPIDVGALLAWVEGYGADDDATAIALRRLRFAIGLPVIAGPACRRQG